MDGNDWMIIDNLAWIWDFNVSDTCTWNRWETVHKGAVPSQRHSSSGIGRDVMVSCGNCELGGRSHHRFIVKESESKWAYFHFGIYVHVPGKTLLPTFLTCDFFMWQFCDVLKTWFPFRLFRFPSSQSAIWQSYSHTPIKSEHFAPQT